MAAQVENAAAVAARYGVTRPAADGRFRIDCPAHGGDGKNLAIWDDKTSGRLRVRCFTVGCDPADVLAALDVDEPPPDTRPSGNNKRWLVATYYTPDGEPRPRYRQPCGPDCARKGCDGTAGKHVWGERGHSPAGVLLKLWPKAGADGSEPVVLVEGEKAAAAVQAAGFSAGSWYGGAKVARRADYSPLKGRDVIAWADDDDDGRQAMYGAVGKAQLAGAASLRLVPMEGGNSKADAADCDPDTIVERIQAAGEMEADPHWPDAPEDDGIARGNGIFDPLSWQAHADRLLRSDPERLLVVWEPKGDASLLVLDDVGTWSENRAEMKILLTRESDKWIGSFLRTETGERSAAVRAHRAACSDDGLTKTLRDVNAAARMAQEPDQESIPALTECSEAELDEGLYLGTPKGVVDLSDGRLLAPEVGRTKLITKRTAVALDLEAHDERVDALTSHLDPEDERYIWSVFARVLTGQPLGFIALVGDTNTGKSTLIGAIAGALGDYAATVSPALIVAGRGESMARPELRDLAERRFVWMDETVREGAEVASTVMMRWWDTGSRVVWRDLFSNVRHDRPVRATLALSWNEISWAGGKGIQPALMRRMRPLVYPRPPVDRGGDYKNQVTTDPACQRAVLARLVRVGMESDWKELPPGPGVDDARRQIKSAAIGEDVVDWIEAHVVASEDGRLWTDELWAAAQPDIERLGLERRTLSMAVKQYLGLPDVRKGRKPGASKQQRYYPGATLTSAAQQQVSLDKDDPPRVAVEHQGGRDEYEPSDSQVRQTLTLSGGEAEERWVREELVRAGWLPRVDPNDAQGRLEKVWESPPAVELYTCDRCGRETAGAQGALCVVCRADDERERRSGTVVGIGGGWKAQCEGWPSCYWSSAILATESAVKEVLVAHVEDHYAAEQT